MTTKYPSQIALEERESALSQEVAAYRVARREYYDAFNAAKVKEIYVERRGNRHSHIRQLKPSASKADHVRALVDNDVYGSQAWKSLAALRKAADRDESIAAKAAKAETYEQVLAARKAAFVERLDGDRYNQSSDLADLAFEFEARLQVARCWAQVAHGVEQGYTPSEVLEGVVQEAKNGLVQQALYGTNRSSSATSNLQVEYSTKGVATFIDSTKNL